MKVDASLSQDIAGTKASAKAIEDDGYDGVWVGESKHDPFLQCLHAADATTATLVGTSVAIAFARTPMTVAHSGYDLARYAQGRFVLGLGSQVKPHIERRFSMPWSHPAPRMREFVLALRAIWSAWQHETVPEFRGEFYTHTLMPPFFAPSPHEYGPPPVFVAGVGELMTEVAGEVADGFFVHPFTTKRYFDRVTLPALKRGRTKVGKSLDGFTICGPSFITVGRNDQEIAAAVKGTKEQIAFYASTPAYRRVLELHGWGELQPELTRLSKSGDWSSMGGLITDEMLHEFSVVGTPAEAGKALRAKLEGAVQRTTFYATYEADPSIWPEVLAAVR